MDILRQFFWIPTAKITDKNCPDQAGRVFIVTGGYGGIGFELCQILYSRNAIVYIAGRSQPKGSDATSKIKESSPKSSGRVEFIQMDLNNLSSIKHGVETFLAKEKRLDVLVNNAGIMLKGSSEPRYMDLQLDTNCIGPCYLYKLLLPILTTTAASSPSATVRVLWAGSIAIQAGTPNSGKIELEESGRPVDTDVLSSYAQTKIGNAFLAREYAKTTPIDGIVHVCYNPGNMRSGLQRHWQGIDMWFMRTFLFFPTIYGAYTQMWAALAPEITPQRSGSYLYPWGRFGALPEAVEKCLEVPPGGGTSQAAKFVAWCEKQSESHA